ncbi:glutamate racemase [Acetivibrio mesophilus]|uniref:Glutamate racemase n=1 Tax=Acetivibrio mesophilus TaxID=2487273 RepID=A0A4Q0I577_9FIRM|nr:glutamate racemase [Acetivibrio mesophilus]ODM26663.1 glutamate racemase [Clostridium sp. Bc-iso-3]RXE58905.1 glutamate racemase [Acetivibrio mesophilus]HHV28455.1 glutamate racemase [Clostridium sp.]
MDNRPIGVFDSGLGGLTVLKEIKTLLPQESVVYFGDSGRAPYGSKSKETVVKYTFQDIRFLLNQDIKMIVIACNTASACSLDQVKHSFDIPIVEVVGPGAMTAVRETVNKKIGVIGTVATVSSGVYEKAILRLDPEVEIYQKACPLFVPLVEEGWWDNDIALRIVEEYLLPLKEKNIDTLVLGCTHYPLLHNTISKVMGDDVKLVSSALEVAKVVKEMINENNLMRDEKIAPVYRYYTSDSVYKFESLGNSILNHEIHSAEKIDIERY